LKDISTENGIYSVGTPEIERTWYTAYQNENRNINDPNSQEG